jgi:hypothetical protein
MSAFKKHLVKQSAQFDGVPGLEQVMAGFNRTMGAFEKIEAEARAVLSDTNLSQTGQQNAIAAVLRTNVPELLRAKVAANSSAAALVKRRAALKPAPIDKANMAEAIVRSDIRKKLSDMDAGDRKVFLVGDLDPITCAAILEAPAAISGIDSATRDIVQKKAVEHANPGALVKLQRDADAVQLLGFASRALREMAAEAAGLDVAALDDFIDAAIPDQRHIEAIYVATMAPLAT